jgi:hypothetical protein
VIVTRDTDFYGADIQAIFDTSYAACRNACLADADCAAFTFNTRSDSCFTKSSVLDRQAYAGALSGEVIDAAPGALAAAEAAQARLGFLLPADFEAARATAEELGGRHPGTGRTAVEAMQAARAARAEGNLLAALRLTGEALAIADAADLWTEYARLSLAMPGDSNASRRAHRERALSAAVNGFLRAGADPVRVSALEVMAEALERLDRGRTAIPALRLAQELSPRDDIARALEEAIARYGFRVTGHAAEADSADPRICAEFNEPLVQAGMDYAPYVSTEVPGLSVVAEAAQLCLAGVTHGERYRVVLRQGLPAASGEALAKSVTLEVYVRDRSPSARFPGRGYILPAGGAVAVPIVTTNLTTVDLSLSRVSDRNVVRALQQDMFGAPIPQWRQDEFDGQIAQRIWEGEGVVESELNRDVTTRLPLGDIVGPLDPGIYVLAARVPDSDPWEMPAATQWFVVSDLGLTTMSGVDGLHVFLRSLTSAEPVAGAALTLVSRANAVLGEVESDAQGYAVFPPGLTLGQGGAEPALLVARNGADDLAFLPLTDPEFDLSDRGVAGREPAGPVDVFLATERGVYRAGDTIIATALARDARAAALPGLPLTAILYRPDGVEYAREVSAEGRAGGHVFRLATTSGVPRGGWRLEIRADPEAPALASTPLLIEDFLPERIDAQLSLPEGPFAPGDTALMGVDVQYLFGAPGAGLELDGDVRVFAADQLEDWPGYVFGRHDQPVSPVAEVLPLTVTDAAGRATVPVTFPVPEAVDRPLRAEIVLRAAEGSGRPIERVAEAQLTPAGPVIGIRPMFEAALPENAEAAFRLVAVDAAGQPTEMPVRWTLNRLHTEYQWYSLYGDWQWEPVTRRERVAGGEVTLGAAPVAISAPVEWGRYEIRVEKLGGTYAASSTEFRAGWYSDGDVSQTPDMLEMSLDAERYRPGDTAQLRLVPRAAGKALVTVVSNRLIDMKAVEVTAGENLVSLPVKEAWGAGAYVTATVLRPAAPDAGQAPARALGLAHAAVDPGAAQLVAAFDMPAEARPRAPLEVALKVEGVQPGETAWASIAAVDVGILNVTGFEAPDPVAHYFGQRRLGIGIRDVYGRLIDGSSGQLGALRQGGDAGAAMRMQAPPPTEEMLAFATGPVEVGADGYARATFDLPAFNGTVRLMAVAWSATGVGAAEAELLVRDPVVLTATLPRFLAPGDEARLLLEFAHATGPAGAVALEVGARGVTLPPGALPAGFPLEAGGRQRFEVPVSADAVGDHTIEIALTTPGGERLEKRLLLPVRLNDPVTTRTSRFQLAAGDTFTFDGNVFAGYRPGTASATLTAGPLARFDAPGLLAALDRYPYGCTEQLASQALPLLYLDEVARALGLEERQGIRERLDLAVRKVLANQGSGGGFGLWRPGSGDTWLDAYVTDFLSRARAQGVAVPDRAFRMALDNLRNRLAYAPDFESGGEDIAYALQVLAREGAASISDLRYYADVKADHFATPLALAQLGAALASYGDVSRADAMFAAAAGRLATLPEVAERPVWRSDYGTPLRDRAAVLTLAVEAGSNAVDRTILARAITPAEGARQLSTQEAVWSLLAANALLGAAPAEGLTVDGQPPSGPLIRFLDGSGADSPIEIRNTGATPATLTLTGYGVPEVPPQKGGEGYAIERRYFTLEGEPADPGAVPVGTRLVTVLIVQPFGRVEARLMVDDPLPAGFEIDNPNLLRAGDLRALDWLDALAEVETAEFRADRFLAAVDWRSDATFRLAYMVRAVTPGQFHHPAASVEDMYRPRFRARTETGVIRVLP